MGGGGRRGSVERRGSEGGREVGAGGVERGVRRRETFDWKG